VSTYELLLILHLLGVFGLIGAAGVSTAVGVKSGRTNDPRMIAMLLDLQHRTEWYVTLPAGALTVIAGTLLIDEAGYSFGDAWIQAAYTLFVLALGLDFLGLVRRNRKVRHQAQNLIDAGAFESVALRKAAGAPIGVAMGVVLDLAFVAFLYLMVVKPGA
jgi:uncharacterized membrane protein